MNKQKISLIVMTAGLVIISLAYLRRNAYSQTVQSVNAFTIYSTRVMTSETGVRNVLEQVTARRSDGAVVNANIVNLGDGASRGRVMTLPNEHQRVTVLDRLKGKSTFVAKELDLRRMQRLYTAPNCAEVAPPGAFVGAGKLLGFDVSIYETNDSAMHSKSYFASALNCAQLKRSIEWKTNGQVNGSTTMEEVTRVDVKEPASELFNIPADYLEMAPSQLRASLWWMHHGTGEPILDCWVRKGQLEDTKYFSTTRQ